MKNFFEKYKTYLTNQAFVVSLLISIIFLLLSLLVNFYAGIYATERASNSVTDIILDNIPVFNLDEIFIYGPFLMWFLVTILCLREPRIIPFTLKSIAFFIIIRSIFITLTHIGPFPDQMMIDYNDKIIKNFTFGGDLFFSAHTGLPFLMALVFYNNKLLRYFFYFNAIFFGCVVLLAHIHYSIDVLSAFFITFSIFHIAKFFFKKDKEMFDKGLPRADLPLV